MYEVLLILCIVVGFTSFLMVLVGPQPKKVLPGLVFILCAILSVVAIAEIEKPAPVAAPATPKPVTVPYNAANILAEAHKLYDQKDYEAAQNKLDQLKRPEVNQPQVVEFQLKLDRLEKQVQAKQAAALRTLGIAARDLYAKNYENTLLGAGMDVTVRAQGPEKKTLYLSYVLMTHALAYQIANSGALTGGDTDMEDTWKKQGFTKAILTDGYENTWTLDLK